MQARYAPLQSTPRPQVDPLLERVEALAPVRLDGLWHRRWRVVPLAAHERQQAIDAAATALRHELRRRMDGRAQALGYLDMADLCSCAASEWEQDRAQGLHAVQMRDRVWAAWRRAIDDARARQRALPAADELLAAAGWSA